MTIPHPNNMTYWDSIGCSFRHGPHATRTQRVRLGGPTGYRDLPDIPMRFKHSFLIEIYQWKHYNKLEAYCPGRDAVSETIESHGVWEPSETALVLSAASASAGLPMIDFGAHIGWFSILAARCGMEVTAIDAEPENLRLVDRSAAVNGLKINRRQMRVTAASAPVDLDIPGHIGLVKIDLEGAENHAIRMIEPQLADGMVDHLLVEVSPVFDDYYPDLVVSLLQTGYLGWVLPEKSRPAASLEHPPQDLEPGRLHDRPYDEVRAEVASWHQKNVWFASPDARWA